MQALSRPLSWLLCAVTFICAWIFYAHTFPEGDDVVYWDWYRDIQSRHGNILGWVVFSLSNWEGANGRMANMLTPFFLYFPPAWLKGLLDSVILTLLLYFGLRLSCLSETRRKGPLAVSLYAFLTLVTLPWWDSMTLTDCVLNYPASDMLALAVLLIWFGNPDVHSKAAPWFAAAIGLVAGAMHEASGVALSAGLITGLMMERGRNLSRLRIFMTVGVTLGALFTLSSPAIWTRFFDGSQSDPDAPRWMILLCSSFYVIILLLTLIVMAIRKELKETLSKRPDLVVLITGALVSTAFTAVGGVIGRSGWFGQSFALIALFRMAPAGGCFTPRAVPNAITTLLSLLFTALWVASAIVQVRLGKEGEEILAEYVASTDGIVYHDYTEEEDLPWWLLRRPGGVPDADDMFPLREYSRLHPSGAPFVVLPSAFKSADLTTFRGTLLHGDDYLTDRLPDSCVMLNPDSPVPGPIETVIQGRRMTVMPVTTPRIAPDTLYYITPRRIDPGDR